MRIYWKRSSIVAVISLLAMSLYMWNFIESKRRVLSLKRNFSVPMQMGSTNTIEVVQPNISTVILQPREVLQEPHGGRLFAVVLVTSMAEDFEQRRSIRETWYRWAKQLNSRVFFIMGFHDFSKRKLLDTLEQETRAHNDLIVDYYEEGYYKLTGKVVRMLKWYNASFSAATAPSFVIKTDQDVFVNLPLLVSTLQRTAYYKKLVSSSNYLLSSSDLLPVDFTNGETYFVGGWRLENAPIIADPFSKWYIDMSDRIQLGWPLRSYPTYANGPCYILSGNIVPVIYETSLLTTLFPFEDVYVVGMIAHDRLNLHVTHLDGMWLTSFDRPFFYWLRDLERQMLAFHPVETPELMIKMCEKIYTCVA